MNTLVLYVLNIMHFNEYGLKSLYKFIKINLLVTTSFYPSNNCNKLWICGIKASMAKESIQAKEVDITLSLAVQEIESGSGVPVFLLMKFLFEHLYFNMAVNFTF